MRAGDELVETGGPGCQGTARTPVRHLSRGLRPGGRTPSADRSTVRPSRIWAVRRAPAAKHAVRTTESESASSRVPSPLLVLGNHGTQRKLLAERPADRAGRPHLEPGALAEQQSDRVVQFGVGQHRAPQRAFPQPGSRSQPQAPENLAPDVRRDIQRVPGVTVGTDRGRGPPVLDCPQSRTAVAGGLSRTIAEAVGRDWAGTSVCLAPRSTLVHFGEPVGREQSRRGREDSRVTGARLACRGGPTRVSREPDSRVAGARLASVGPRFRAVDRR